MWVTFLLNPLEYEEAPVSALDILTLVPLPISQLGLHTAINTEFFAARHDNCPFLWELPWQLGSRYRSDDVSFLFLSLFMWLCLSLSLLLEKNPLGCQQSQEWNCAVQTLLLLCCLRNNDILYIDGISAEVSSEYVRNSRVPLGVSKVLC